MSLSHNETKRLFDLIWPEVTEEIEIWIDQLRSILEDCDAELGMKEVFQAQGSIRALRDVLQIPENLLAAKLSNEEEQANDRTSGEPG